MIKKINVFLNKKQKFLLAFLLVGILITSALEMIGLGSIPVFINLLFNPDKLFLYLPQNNFIDFISNKNYLDKILFSSIVLSIFFIFKNFFIFLVGYFQAVIFLDIKVRNSKRLFQGYLNTPYSFHLERNPAIITRNIIGDLELGTSHISSLMNLVREILLITVIFILLLLANPVSSLIVFLSIALFAIMFYIIVRKKMMRLSQSAQYHRGRQVQLVNQVFGAIKDAKILARESYFINEFFNETKGAERINIFSAIVASIPRLSMEIFAVIAIFLVIILLISTGSTKETMLPMLALLGVVTIRLIPSFHTITYVLTKMRRSIVSFNLIVNELMNLEKHSYKMNYPEKIKEKNNVFMNKNIELKNITYEYPNSKKKVLKNISLTIKSGNYVAIIGKTGSGKSTLANIILGLLEPSMGQVLVDGQDIREGNLMWQKKIGYISQDVYLMDDTIKRNVAFGLPDHKIDENKILNSVKLAQLSDFISDLPLGLNTIVGDRGIKLSGGQIQRIGIARALYRKSEVLVLDEATSSLDFETEKNLIKDLENLRSDHTLITITHRLPAIKNFDEIFLLSDGKLIDRGHIDQLISRNTDLKI